MADRKVYATVEGTVLVPVRVKREVIVTVDEGASANDAISAAAIGEDGGGTWDVVDCQPFESQDDVDDINASLRAVADKTLQIDNIDITESK